MKKFVPWILSVVLMTILLTLTVSVDLPVGKPGRSATFYVGSILTPWPAYATVDYQCDGVDDHIQIQQALDSLPMDGGKIVIYTGNYHLGATVSRAIDGIVIEGVGSGTYLANNGVTNIFNVGVQKRWVFKDLQVDNGGISVATATEWSFDNVWIGAGYVAKRSAFTTTQGQDMANKIYVDGAIAGLPASTGNITGGGLTSRIVKWVNSTSIGDASNTDTQVSDAVSKSHMQGTDTSLGIQIAGLNMGAHSITNVASISAIGDISSDQDINVGNDVNVTNDLDVGDDLIVGGSTELQDQVSLTGSGLIYQQKTMPIQISRIIASGKPDRVERGIFQGFSLPVGGSDEELFSCQCIPSNWHTGTNMTLYVGGWLDTANTGKKFQLRGAYNSWSDGDVVPATSMDVDVETDTGAAAQYQVFKIKFTIPAGSMARGDALGIRLSRIAATSAEITGEFVVEGIVLVYQCDSLGSATD